MCLLNGCGNVPFLLNPIAEQDLHPGDLQSSLHSVENVTMGTVQSQTAI